MGQATTIIRRRRRGGGGGAFSPSDLSGLNVWLKADGILWQDSARTTAATADGDPVGAWDDASGNNSHYTQSTSGSRPTLKTAVVNGLPVLRFDGSNDLLTGPDHVSALTAGTCFLVVKVDADPPADPQSGLWTYGTSVDSTHFPYSDGSVYDSFGTNSRKSTGNPTPALTSWRVYGVVSANGDWRSYIDGTLHYSTASNTVAFVNAPKLGESAVSSYHLDGDVAEIIIYDSALGSTDRDDVESYLATKYAL